MCDHSTRDATRYPLVDRMRVPTRWAHHLARFQPQVPEDKRLKQFLVLLVLVFLCCCYNQVGISNNPTVKVGLCPAQLPHHRVERRSGLERSNGLHSKNEDLDRDFLQRADERLPDPDAGLRPGRPPALPFGSRARPAWTWKRDGGPCVLFSSGPRSHDSRSPSPRPGRR